MIADLLRTELLKGRLKKKCSPPEARVTTPVPFEELEEVSKKIVRGLEYIFGEKRYIEKPYEVEVYFLDEKHGIKSLYDLLKKHGTQTSYGAGFYVERAAATDKTKSVIYQIKVWNKLTIFESLMTPDPEEKSKPHPQPTRL